MVPFLKSSITVHIGRYSVADPDSPDPHVFGPPGSTCFRASRILLSTCKNSKKNLDSYYFVTLFDFLSLKNDVNVPSKVLSGKNCVQK